jgi:acyl-ACP thioesterase
MEQIKLSMQNTLKRNYTVSSYEVNPSGKSRLTTLANYLQESAYHHAGHLGVGYKQLAEQHRAWVLSRMRIRMISYPVWDDVLTVETWPRGIEKLFAIRDFRITGDIGKPVAEASTCWLMVDDTTLRPQRIPPDFIPIKTRTDAVFKEAPGKIELPDTMVPVGMRNVVYSDLDVVGHVNNVKYIEWITDLLETEHRMRSGIKDFTINYTAEAKAGDEVEITFSKRDGMNAFAAGLNLGNGKECFRAGIEFFPG